MSVKSGLNDHNYTVETMALRIANESPALNDLTPEQLEQIAKIVITQNLSTELSNKAKIANINYKDERTMFIMQSSKTGSEYTQMSYFKALKKLEKYTAKNDIKILQMTPGQADDFILSLTGSPNSKSIIIAGVSTFCLRIKSLMFCGSRIKPCGKALRRCIWNAL